LTRNGGQVAVDSWPVMSKEQVAARLIAHIAKAAEKAS
jgi:phosphopantothenoylcysteine decarboxylase/phosphopantothenate--cysteine ligase